MAQSNLSQLESTVNAARDLRKDYQYDEAIEMLYSVVNTLENPSKKREKIVKARAQNEIASVFKDMGFYDDALDYNQQAIDLVRGVDDDLTAKLYLYKANFYFSKSESQVDVNQYDQKIVDLEKKASLKALEIYKKNNDSTRFGYIYRQLSNASIQEKNYEQAERWAKKALNEYSKRGLLTGEVSLLDLLTLIYNDTNRYTEAIKTGETGLKMVEDNDLDRSNYSFDTNLHKSYKGVGQIDKALFYLERYTKNEYSKSISDKGSVQKIQSERLRAKAKELEKREVLTKTKVKKIKRFNIFLLIGLGVLGLLFFLFSRGQKLKEQNLELKLKQREQEAELATINAMMDGREIERNEIGQFLHDHVSALVNTANIQLEVLANEASLHNNKKLETTQSILDDIADKVRNLSHQLLSNVLQKYGLAIALDDLCASLNSSKIEFSTHSTLKDGTRYNHVIENKLYSVVQELCNNILKHSQANKADIYLLENETHLMLKIIDNGIGFQEEDIKKGGVGLYQVTARINSLGGKLSFSNNPTTVEIKIPLGVAKIY